MPNSIRKQKPASDNPVFYAFVIVEKNIYILFCRVTFLLKQRRGFEKKMFFTDYFIISLPQRFTKNKSIKGFFF